MKRIQTEQEEVTSPLFINNTIVYTENLRDSTKKLQELITEFSGAAE